MVQELLLDIYVKRSIYYGCKQLTKGLERGQNYDKMKKSIVISFVKTKLFPPEVPMHSMFSLRESVAGCQLSDFLELHYLELDKLDFKSKELDDLNPLEQLGLYIRCSGDDRESEFVEILVQKGEKVISMTDTVLRKISEEERLQALRESRETAQLFNRMEKAYAREKGLREGREEGFRQGREQGLEQGIAQGIEQRRLSEKIVIAKNLKNANTPLDIIVTSTGLSAEGVERL